MVVVLHGCTQNATDYGNDSGWVELADAWQFSLVLPQQRLINNFNYCFNWFERTDTTRGSGEVASVISMVDYAIDAVGADFLPGVCSGTVRRWRYDLRPACDLPGTVRRWRHRGGDPLPVRRRFVRGLHVHEPGQEPLPLRLG